MTPLARALAIANAPVIERSALEFLARAGGDNRGAWPVRRHLGVYFARRNDGALKIGISSNPAWRVFTLGLAPVAFAIGCDYSHENRLHGLLRSECVGGEFFSGKHTEIFVSAVVEVSHRKASEFGFARHFAHRAASHRKAAEGLSLGADH